MIHGDPLSGDKRLAVPVHFCNDSAPRFAATSVHTTHIRYVYPHSLQRLPVNYMPGFKTIGYVVPALLAVAGSYATPFQNRGVDEIISQCKHNFAYAFSLFPISHFHWYRAPTTDTNPTGYYSYAFDGGPTLLNTALVNKFDSVGGKTTFCSFNISSVKTERSLTVVC